MVKVRVGHNSNFRAFEKSTPAKGYEFQFALARKILERLRRFSSVTTKDGNGNVLSLDNFAKRGRDGGIDLVIEIETQTDRACKQIAGKVKKILLEKI